VPSYAVLLPKARPSYMINKYKPQRQGYLPDFGKRIQATSQKIIQEITDNHQ
jgi:hypothetical protein